MEEYLDIVTSTGEFTNKTALKSDVHKNGWYHNTIHLWLYTDDGKILLQQRSRKKPIYPLLWDVSVAGHVDAGESFKAAVIRETKEEISLELVPNDLKKISVQLHESSYENGAILDNEFHHIYIAKLNVAVSKLVPQPNEVEALKLVSIAQFKQLLANSVNNNHFIATNTDYYELVLAKINNEIIKN